MIRIEHIGHKNRVQLFTGMNHQGILSKDTFRQYFLGYRIRIGNDDKRRFVCLKHAQHLGAQNLGRRIRMTVFNMPVISRWKEIHLLPSRELHQVVIKVSGLFEVIHQAQEATASLPEE